MKKRVISVALFASALFLPLAAFASDSGFPDDPAGRWEFFKANYHGMPTGFKVCLLLIVLLIAASVVYYKLSAGPGAESENKKDGAEPPEEGADPNGE